jgi:ATPase family AAA domain-containing protein 1
MTHWDGLASANSTGQPQRICILGATNRIQDIDEAILRRMPKKFAVPLPSANQRRGIFNLVLKGTKIDHENFDLDFLVKLSSGLSGSDIKEACRDAAMIPMRECIKRKNASGSLRRQVNPDEIRGVTTDDFFRRQFDLQESVSTDEEVIDVNDVAVSAEVPIRGVVEDSSDDPAWTDEDSSEDERNKKKGKKERK